MIAKLLPVLSIISLCILAYLFFSTTPDTVGSFGVLVVFLCLYIVLLGLITSSIFYGARMIRFIGSLFQYTARRPAISYRHAYYYGTVVALLPMMLIGLQASAVLSVYSAALILAFGILGIFYISKRL
jgi:hypothetical protein